VPAALRRSGAGPRPAPEDSWSGSSQIAESKAAGRRAAPLKPAPEFSAHSVDAVHSEAAEKALPPSPKVFT
jgi:hypothetical protein